MGARPPRSPNLFKRTELRRAIKAAHEVGMIVTGIEVSKSGFLLTVDDKQVAKVLYADRNEWDDDHGQTDT